MIKVPTGFNLSLTLLEARRIRDARVLRMDGGVFDLLDEPGIVMEAIDKDDLLLANILWIAKGKATGTKESEMNEAVYLSGLKPEDLRSMRAQFFEEYRDFCSSPIRRAKIEKTLSLMKQLQALTEQLQSQPAGGEPSSSAPASSDSPPGDSASAS